MQQYLYFLTNPGNEIFLKKEISMKYPQFSFSFSKPGICTFKNNDKSLSPREVSLLDIIYARSRGISIGLIKKELLAQTLEQYQNDFPISKIPRDYLEHPLSHTTERASDIDAPQIVVVDIDEKQAFIGKENVDKFNSPPGRLYYDITHTSAPSRAYHKAKEAFLLLQLANKRNLTGVDFGCSPGGSTAYLLEQGHKITGVDPAQMDPAILSHRNFDFINKPIQELSARELPQDIDFILSDINLNPSVVLKQINGLFKTNAPKLALITLKTPKVDYLKDVGEWRSFFNKMHYKSIDFVQLSSHRKECLAIARK